MTTIVSAVITTHNRKDLLEKAILSVLNQSYKNIETIVVDDASDDGTDDLIDQRFNGYEKFHYIRIDESKGGNYARNMGIKKSSGKYVAFLDDDDEWLSDKIEKQVEFLNSNPEYDVVSCNRYLVHDNGLKNPIPVTNFPEQGDISNEIWFTDVFVTSTLMIRKEFLINIGMFDEKLRFWQDYELMIRCAQKTKVGIILDPLVLYRIIQKDPSRLTNNVIGWELSVTYINEKHKYTIETLDKSVLKKYHLKIAEDGMYRANTVGDKARRKKYLKQIFLLKPNLKNFYKYLFNTMKIRFWR